MPTRPAARVTLDQGLGARQRPGMNVSTGSSYRLARRRAQADAISQTPSQTTDPQPSPAQKMVAGWRAGSTRPARTGAYVGPAETLPAINRPEAAPAPATTKSPKMITADH